MPDVNISDTHSFQFCRIVDIASIEDHRYPHGIFETFQIQHFKSVPFGDHHQRVGIGGVRTAVGRPRIGGLRTSAEEGREQEDRIRNVELSVGVAVPAAELRQRPVAWNLLGEEPLGKD